MISFRASRIYVSSSSEEVPKGYTHQVGLLNLVGLKGSNIHIHLGKGWDKADEEKAHAHLQAVVLNLSCNPVPPTITIGQFDERISPMLLALEYLSDALK